MKTLKSLYQITNKIFSILTQAEKRNFTILIIISVVVAILEVFGVALILPFISVTSNPDLISQNDSLEMVYNYLDFSSPNDFIVFLGLIYLVFLIFSQIFKAFVTFYQLRFIFMREASISRRLLEAYLKKPYSWFLDKHSGELGKSVLSEVAEAIHYCIHPLLKLFSQSALAFVLIILIVIVNPYVALITTLFLIFLNQFVFNWLKQGITDKGAQKVKSNKTRFKSVVEAFGAIKEIKLNGIEKVYTKRFSKSSIEFANTNSSIQIISIIPKYILETFVFGFLILFIIISINNGSNINDTLPTITLFAFAALRLVPSAQQIFASMSKIHFSNSGLDEILNQLSDDKELGLSTNQKNKLEILQSVDIKNLSFSYEKSKNIALKNINISIPLGSKIGLVGYTGSGKTTMVDILLGLLKPSQGHVFIDENKIDLSNTREWQNSIGYVPQQIYLSDQTIAENIAFGLSMDELNLSQVKKVAKMARIDEFITSDLEDGYKTKVGERGVRLSGGQRQRIGIARALYNNPTLLILDEATSALDNITEKAVMDSITDEFKNMTMIIIAHRLNTVRMCNCIHLLDSGEIVASGTYDQLLASSKEFNEMVQV